MRATIKLFKSEWNFAIQAAKKNSYKADELVNYLVHTKDPLPQKLLFSNIQNAAIIVGRAYDHARENTADSTKCYKIISYIHGLPLGDIKYMSREYNTTITRPGKRYICDLQGGYNESIYDKINKSNSRYDFRKMCGLVYPYACGFNYASYLFHTDALSNIVEKIENSCMWQNDDSLCDYLLELHHIGEHRVFSRAFQVKLLLQKMYKSAAFVGRFLDST